MQVGNQEKPIHKKCVVCGKEVIGSERTVCDDDGGLLAPIGREPQPGDVFADRYEIVGLIGDGGWGKVYKAQHKLMKRSVAIKVLLPHLVKSQQALKRFQQEARAASSLNHPNVMTVFDFGMTDDGLPFLVMDLLEGTSLSAALQELHYLPVDRALRIFVQVCEGLAHAHEKGVIHRDIKPNNLMLVNFIGQTDFVKIVDFGIAKLATPTEGEGEDLTQTGEIFGSPMYMSPEQCRGKELDARSDIYSTGCVLYRCLAGRPAFAGRDAMECMFKQVHEQPIPFRDACPQFNLPAALEVIVLKALAKEPEDRFQHMIEFRDALIELYRDIMGEVPVTASTQLRLYAVTPGSTEEVSHSESTGMLASPSVVPVDSAASDAGVECAADIAETRSPASALSPAQNAAAQEAAPSAPVAEQPVPPAPVASPVPTPVPTPASAETPPQISAAAAPPPQAAEPEVKATSPVAAVTAPDRQPESGSKLPLLIGAAVLILGCVIGIPMMHKNETSPVQTTPNTSTVTADGEPSEPVKLPAVVNTGTVDALMKKAKDSVDEADYQSAITALTTAQAETSKLDANTANKYLLEILPILGQCLLDVDNPDAARKTFTTALPMTKTAFGQDSPEYARAETGLALATIYLGDPHSAEPMLNHALMVLNGEPAAKREGLGDIYYGLARVAESKKDIAKANQLLNEALKRKESEGPPDLESANLLVNIAQVYMLRHQYDKARGLLEQAVAIEKEKLGEESIPVAGSIKNLAVVYYQTGKTAKAESLFKQALDISNKLNFGESLLAAEVMSSLAILYANDGRLNDAMGLAKHSLEIRRAKLGDNAPQVKRDEQMIANLTAAVKKRK